MGELEGGVMCAGLGGDGGGGGEGVVSGEQVGREGGG